MPMRSIALCLALILICLVMPAMSALPERSDPPDPFMGDWQGTLQSPGGAERPICAQVICWGRGEYQANLLDEFDKRIEPIAVLRGSGDGEAVVFGETARIQGDAFTGTLTGDRAGTFSMKHVVRLSPTLGAKPPEGAIVLFDGTTMDEWDKGRGRPEVLELDRYPELAGDNRVVYLRNQVWCPATMKALLQVGSDDGVKVWLNGELIHANNVSRPLSPYQDQVPVTVVEGWNTIMLKVVQCVGGWGACARVRTPEGGDIEGFRIKLFPVYVNAGPDGHRDNSGRIVTWQIAGPYTEEGKDGQALFDVAFPPEKEGEPGVEWGLINDVPLPPREWKLTDGAAEITPRSGSRSSTREFTDHKIHVEFRSPFQPTARGQGRGNSGVYVQSRYEVQVLDSYGLAGKDNECGGFYKKATPLVNMCAPPLQWQTYDIEFHAARYDEKQKKVTDAVLTVYHNGVLIHDKVKIPVKGTAEPGWVASGGILLQDHGNAVQYRNIWVQEL